VVSDERPIHTDYGDVTPEEIDSWPVQVCPTCGREHAHPKYVVADYWPQCFPCFMGIG
jgi:hypothetical protein